jgi:hypothetical protein
MLQKMRTALVQLVKQQSAMMSPEQRMSAASLKIGRMFNSPEQEFEVLENNLGVSALRIEEALHNPASLKNLVRNRNVVGGNSRALQAVEAVFSKPPEKRGAKEAAVVLPLLAMMQFFQRKRKQIMLEDLGHLGCAMKWEVRQPGEVLFRQGEPGTCCYLILKGQVQVSIRDPLREREAE